MQIGSCQLKEKQTVLENHLNWNSNSYSSVLSVFSSPNILFSLRHICINRTVLNFKGNFYFETLLGTGLLLKILGF